MVAAEPGPSPGSHVICAGEVRLDNREEIEAVTGGGARSDLDLVMAAYRKWGASCPQYLVGDFAFVLWDPRSQRLLAACDPMGIRPLYTGVDTDVLVCGARARTVAAALPGRQDLNRAFLIRYLAEGGTSDIEETAFRAVSRLPPGYSLVSERGRVSRQRHASIGDWPEERFVREDDYVERFRELLIGSVRRRLHGVPRAAVHLSGGLDSSSLTCIAGMLKRTGAIFADVSAHSLTFPGTPDSDESAFQRCVLAEYPEVSGHQVAADDLWAWKGLFGDLAYAPDDLETYSMQRPLNLALAESVSATSATTVLIGEGADQLLGASVGRDFIAEAPVLAAAAELRRLSRRRGALRAAREGLAAVRSFARWRFREDIPAGPLTRPSLGSYGGDLAYGRLLCASLRGRSTQRNRAEARGATVELPFLDRALVEFVLRLPRTFRASRGRPKHKVILRRAMTGVLPDLVRERTRLTPVSFLEPRGLQHEQRVLDCVVATSAVARLGLASEAAVRAAYAAARTADSPSAVASFRRLMDVESWLRSLESQEGA